MNDVVWDQVGDEIGLADEILDETVFGRRIWRIDLRTMRDRIACVPFCSAFIHDFPHAASKDLRTMS